MKLVNLKCSNCGAELSVDLDSKVCFCQYCGNKLLFDNETVHHKIENAFEVGYEQELGRQKARLDLENKRIEEEKKQREKKAELERKNARYEGLVIYKCFFLKLARNILGILGILTFIWFFDGFHISCLIISIPAITMAVALQFGIRDICAEIREEVYGSDENKR